MKKAAGPRSITQLSQLINSDIKYLENDVSDLKAYIGYTAPDVYGLEADLENKRFTRLAGAVGKQAGADFDGINAFGKRRRCCVSLSGEVIAYYGDENYEEDGAIGTTINNIMVEQPAFWYKVVPLKIEKGIEGYILRKARYYISDTPRPGFKLHPAFIKDSTKMDKIYLSAYEGGIRDTSEGHRLISDEQIADFDNDILMSTALVKPCSGASQALTLANARKLAHNIGEDWDISLIQTTSLTELLFLIEYGTFDSQTAIGLGVANKSDGTGKEAEKTGATSSLGNASGSVTNANGYNVVSYRGEENLWGNIWPWVDGINIETPAPFAAGQVGTLYIADHDFADDTKDAPYKDTGIHPDYGNGYISAFGYSEEYDWLFIPVEYTGNSALPVGDYFWNVNPGWSVAVLGGCCGDGAGAGAFYWNLSTTSSYHNQYIGARLIYRPTPKEAV